MRALRLARIAAEAEGLRLRHRAQRALIAAILASIASVFMLGALVFCHLAAWFYLRAHWQPPETALILAGADVLLALVLVLVAARSTTSRVEVEALAVRQRALESIGSTLAISALATQLLRIAVSVFRRTRS
ncbi:MAG TPA: hypothetical protein VKT26_05755 [Acetobacteraceae bacterium]|nr:hypothetical protein [Acetobacteraceae bacterium]